VTPAIDWSPSFDTKIQVREEVQRLHQDADAHLDGHRGDVAGIEPELRSFMQ
jgi:hypothetical protein